MSDAIEQGMKTTQTLPANWKLSPVMLDCLRWLFGDRTPGLEWSGATLLALRRRGLVEDLGGWKLTEKGAAMAASKGWKVST